MTSASLDTGVLYRDENLERLSQLPSESVDLIYLDPPFFSNRVYEVIWGDEAEVRSFADRWEGGIQHYIGWMKARVIEMRRVLKKTGSFYLHCDPHAGHYLKVMLDEVFSPSLFRSEVIWKRTGAHNSARRWGPVHDTILFYTVGRSYTWNRVYQPYDETYLAEFDMEDERGPFMDVSLTGPGLRRGDSAEPWGGHNPSVKGRHWQPPSTAYEVYEQLTGENLAKFSMAERLDRMDKAGLIFWPRKKGGVPRFKQYLQDAKGMQVQDIITDIPPLNARAREREHYPTQKPQELLERIIAASSNRGGVVLDPFCGCGTTIAAAETLRREWIGIDISTSAMEVMKRRLWRQGCRPTIYNEPNTIEAVKALPHFEFQNWVINAVNGTHSPRRVHDMGIDGYWFFTKEPIQVKQSERVGRPVVDEFQTAMRRGGHSTGYIVAFSFTSGAAEEVARVKKAEGLDIRLVKVAEVLLLKKRPSSNLGPQPPADVVPMPPVRKQKDLPSLEELVASARKAVG